MSLNRSARMPGRKSALPRIVPLAGLVLATSCFALVFPEPTLPAISDGDLPSLTTANDAYVALGHYHKTRSANQNGQGQASPKPSSEQTTDTLKLLDRLLERPLRIAVVKYAKTAIAARERAGWARWAAATVIAVLFVILPAWTYGWHYSLIVPAICALFALVSLESASRVALLGAIAIAAFMLTVQFVRDNARCEITFPVASRLISACAIGFLPFCAILWMGFQCSSWIDSRIDHVIDLTEQAMVTAIGKSMTAMRAGAEQTRGPWYDPREIFVFRPLREAVETHSPNAAASLHASTQVFYGGVRGVLQVLRFLSLLVTWWTAIRLASLFLFKAILFAGGTVVFELGPQVVLRKDRNANHGF